MVLAVYSGVYEGQIFTTVDAYAVGCYMRHSGFPRRTLLGNSLNKLVLCSLLAVQYAKYYTGQVRFPRMILLGSSEIMAMGSLLDTLAGALESALLKPRRSYITGSAQRNAAALPCIEPVKRGGFLA